MCKLPIPRFASEAEERQFWLTHDSCDYIDWSKATSVVFPNLKRTIGDDEKGVNMNQTKVFVLRMVFVGVIGNPITSNLEELNTLLGEGWDIVDCYTSDSDGTYLVATYELTKYVPN